MGLYIKGTVSIGECYEYYIETIYQELLKVVVDLSTTETVRMDDLDDSKIHIFLFVGSTISVYWKEFEDLDPMECRYCVQQALERYSTWFHLHQHAIACDWRIGTFPDIYNGKPCYGTTDEIGT